MLSVRRLARPMVNITRRISAMSTTPEVPKVSGVRDFDYYSSRYIACWGTVTAVYTTAELYNDMYIKYDKDYAFRYNVDRLVNVAAEGFLKGLMAGMLFPITVPAIIITIIRNNR